MERTERVEIVFLLLAICFSFLFDGISAKTFHVKQQSVLPTIGGAISAASAFDTIVVDGGTYREKKIVVDKPLYLKGMNKPVIDGENKYELLSVFSSNVTIEGFEFRNGGISSVNDLAGIKVYKSHDVIVRNNSLVNMFFGIYFQECSRCTAKGNRINSSARNEVQSGNGIHCWKSDSLMIADNYITGQRDGIYFEFVTESKIRNNISERNLRYGLHFMFSHDNSYWRNTFQYNGAGVAVMYTHHVTMIDNTFNENWGGSSYGLLMKDISDSEVRHNTFSRNTSGIYLEGCSRNIIAENKFISNGSALRIQSSCDQNVIEKNNFMTNTFDVNTNGTMMMNEFKENYWDKYEGYDLNHDKTGDIPYHPVSMYSMIIEKIPIASIFLRSFMVVLLDRTERAIPSLTPENLRDDMPHITPYK